MNCSLKKDTMPLPESAFRDFIYIYKCDKMYAAVTKTGFDIYPGIHAHDGYEFIMPITDMPYISVDGKVTACARQMFLCINPWQRHGVTSRINEVQFIDVVVDRIYIEEIYSTLCGKRLSPLRNEVVGLSYEIQNIIKMFINEAKETGFGRDMVLQSLCCQFSIEVLRLMCGNIVENSTKVDSVNEKRISKVMDYLKDSYYRDCSLDRLAEIAGMSRYHFIRFFRKVTGKSPYDYLIDIRIGKAKELLMSQDMPVADIAAKCGFNHASHFSDIFRKRIGIAPSKFREMLRL